MHTHPALGGRWQRLARPDLSAPLSLTSATNESNYRIKGFLPLHLVSVTLQLYLPLTPFLARELASPA